MKLRMCKSKWEFGCDYKPLCRAAMPHLLCPPECYKFNYTWRCEYNRYEEEQGTGRVIRCIRIPAVMDEALDILEK